MTAVCIACYALLAFFGVQFIRGHAGHVRRFAVLMGFEVAYFFSVAAMWLVPGLGMSVGAASGLANGGLMAQIITIFPVWAPLLAFWAARRLSVSSTTGAPMP